MPRLATHISPLCILVTIPVARGIQQGCRLTPRLVTQSVCQMSSALRYRTRHNTTNSYKEDISWQVDLNNGIFWPSLIRTFREIITRLYGAELIAIVKPLFWLVMCLFRIKVYAPREVDGEQYAEHLSKYCSSVVTANFRLVYGIISK